MPAKKPLNLFRYGYLDPASQTLYSFTVGLPQLMLQEFRSGDTTNLGSIILEKLSDDEKKRLKEMLGIEVLPDRFQVLPVAPHLDSIAGLKLFNGDNGRRFWIYSKNIVKF